MEPLWTDVAEVIVLSLQLGVLGIAALVAWRQVKEARRLREEQTRPFVVIDFEVERSLIFLRIANIGSTLARDVRFSIDPPFATALGNPLAEVKMLNEGISTLVPGKELRTLFDSAIRSLRDPQGTR